MLFVPRPAYRINSKRMVWRRWDSNPILHSETGTWVWRLCYLNKHDWSPSWFLIGQFFIPCFQTFYYRKKEIKSQKCRSIKIMKYANFLLRDVVVMVEHANSDTKSFIRCRHQLSQSLNPPFLLHLAHLILNENMLAEKMHWYVWSAGKGCRCCRSSGCDGGLPPSRIRS